MLTTHKDLQELDDELAGLSSTQLPAVLFIVGGDGLTEEVNVGYARTSEDIKALLPKAKDALLALRFLHTQRPLLVLVPAPDEMVVEAVKVFVKTHLMVKNLVEDLKAAALAKAEAHHGKPN